MIFLDTSAIYALAGKFGAQKDREKGSQFGGLHEFSRDEKKRCEKSVSL
jgi:hypothetical protein